MKIAISGAGVAGPALAYWLHRTGHEPTLIERAPRFRTGGYVIDFWGVGYDVAEKMGISEAIHDAGYQVESIRSRRRRRSDRGEPRRGRVSSGRPGPVYQRATRRSGGGDLRGDRISR